MDYNNSKVLLLSIAGLLISQLSSIAHIVVDEPPLEMFENSDEDDHLFPLRKRKRKPKFLQDHMKDLMATRLSPTQPLEFKEPLNSIFRDPGRNYIEVVAGLKGWEFFEISNHLEPFISKPRTVDSVKKRRCKHDINHRLFFTLEWLHCGIEMRKQEFQSGWSKTSLNEDIPHVLKAISSGLNGYISWPNTQVREVWANQHQGIFSGCIGILDIMETEIQKPKNLTFERETWSGKMKCNTIKTLSVISKSGEVIFLLTGIPGGRSDRDIWTSCDLYLHAGLYFSEGQWLAADGGFMGDGNLVMSYNNIFGDENRSAFNYTFTEMRKQVENQFGRITLWFPILGNAKKKWDLDVSLFNLTIYATFNLHNWLIINRGLNYDPTTNPKYLFTRYY